MNPIKATKAHVRKRPSESVGQLKDAVTVLLLALGLNSQRAAILVAGLAVLPQLVSYITDIRRRWKQAPAEGT
jgi:hypothetical protein